MFMWKEVLIGVAGIGIWILSVVLIKRRRSTEGWIAKIISIAYLLIYPMIFHLSSISYLICIAILWMGIIVFYWIKHRHGSPADDPTKLKEDSYT
jgi:hypothetical protein